MALRNKLYTLDSKAVCGGKIRFTVGLVSESVIFGAHFPGQPVLPGVCVIDICRELMEDVCACPLEICEVKNAKFLSVISPVELGSVNYDLAVSEADGGIVKCVCSVSAEDKVYAKLSLNCVRV